MKMWPVHFIILLLFCYASLATGNGKVYFVSKNFHNVLHWAPMKPASTGEKVFYSVQYWSDSGEEFKAKEECQNITALTCDLTAETPSIPDVHYHAQVYVNGRLHGRTVSKFKPIAETILGAPVLSLHTTMSSLFVNVTLPLGPDNVSVGEYISKSKNGPSKTVMVYILKITEPKWATLVNETTTGHFAINLKNNNTNYCGHVVYRPFSEWGRPVSENTLFCVTLTGGPWVLTPWLSTGAFLLVAIVTMAVLWTCNYVKGGKNADMPQSLVTTSGTPSRVLQSPDSCIIISTPVVSTSRDQTVYAIIQMKPNVPSDRVGGYSPQDIICQAWQDSTGSSEGSVAPSPTPNPLDVSAQSSEIYSAVAVHVPADENEDFQQASTEDRETSDQPLPPSTNHWDKCGTSNGVPALRDVDACESNPGRPLLLTTVRDTNGQLMLPLLTIKSTASPLTSERKPLLSDLIHFKTEQPSLASSQSFDGSEWSDSGCDDCTVNTPTLSSCSSHYSPTQPALPDFHLQCQNTPSCESGYKQNWMSAIRLGAASNDSCEYRRTNNHLTWDGPKEEEEEEGEGDTDRGGEGSRPIVLGSWMVQVQE